MRRRGSVLCVGLDPHWPLLPAPLRAAALAAAGPGLEAGCHAARAHVLGIIDAVAESAVAVKPQIAFFEALGPAGLGLYREAIAAARQAGLVVIADVKRGDIGSTAEAYAAAHLGRVEIEGWSGPVFGADAVTVNPYLGLDGVRPFLDACFVLVRTSNPSAGEIQDLVVDGEPLYLRVARLVARWGAERRGTQGLSDVGAVVGATYPREARAVRQVLPDAWLLVPGLGAQGAAVEDLTALYRPDGLGLLAVSARAIIYAPAGEGDWKDAVRAAARETRARLEGLRPGRR